MSPSHDYWSRQTLEKPLFPDIEWNKPERRDQAGKLGIIGGNKLGFIAAAESYQTALDTGVGQVRVLVPDVLRRTIPAAMTDVMFGASNPSGGLAAGALDDMKALGAWADSILLVGDAGRNAETAVLYEEFITKYDGPLTITRDAIDLVKNNPNLIVERPNTLIITSFAQTQKLFQSMYYPKILTHSMQLLQLVEALRKFTITYPCTVVTLHSETIIIADKGNIVTQSWNNPMAIWRGSVATRAATYWLWNPLQILPSVTSSIAM